MVEEGPLLNPQSIINESGIADGMKVADLGCGRAGHFVFPMARAVGDKGVVYAVDIQENALASVASTARVQGLLNVRTTQADLSHPGGAPIATHSLDAVFIITNLVDFNLFSSMFQEAVRLLRGRGRIIVVDWLPGPIPYAPDPDHRVDPDAVRGLALDLPVDFVREFKPGKYFFGLIFEKRG